MRECHIMTNFLPEKPFKGAYWGYLSISVEREKDFSVAIGRAVPFAHTYPLDRVRGR